MKKQIFIDFDNLSLYLKHSIKYSERKCYFSLFYLACVQRTLFETENAENVCSSQKTQNAPLAHADLSIFYYC